MGLRDWAKEKAAGWVAGWIEERCPMLNKAIKWLTAKPGRKRGTAAVLAILAGGLRFGDAALEKLCAEQLLTGGLCSLDAAPWAEAVDFASVALLQVVEPGMTFSAVAMGLWGLYHARQRAKKGQ